MTRTRLDLVVAAFVAGILLVGGGLTWQTYRQAQVHGEMMGGMGGVHGPDPVWYLLGTLLVAGFVAVGYLAIRDQLAADALSVENAAKPNTTSTTTATNDSVPDDPQTTNPPNVSEPDGASVSIEPDGSEPDGSEPDGSEPDDAVETPNDDERTMAYAGSGVTPRPRILDVLPDDERRILEPVLESPGLTQIELRDRSNFSKSKVSQTVSDLEKRGLLYREPQGRTYRVYPSDDLEPDRDHRLRG